MLLVVLLVLIVRVLLFVGSFVEWLDPRELLHTKNNLLIFALEHTPRRVQKAKTKDKRETAIY